MKLRHKIGFGIYLVNLIMCTAVGFVYFFSSEMLPFHAQVIGKNWAELDRGIQIVILALIHFVGVGSISVGLSGLVVLFIPFRRGENWANWMLFLITIVFGGLGFFVTFKAYSVVSTWPYILASMVLGLLGFLFSRGMEKKK